MVVMRENEKTCVGEAAEGKGSGEGTVDCLVIPDA